MSATRTRVKLGSRQREVLDVLADGGQIRFQRTHAGYTVGSTGGYSSFGFGDVLIDENGAVLSKVDKKMIARLVARGFVVRCPRPVRPPDLDFDAIIRWQDANPYESYRITDAGREAASWPR